MDQALHAKMSAGAYYEGEYHTGKSSHNAVGDIHPKLRYCPHPIMSTSPIFSVLCEQLTRQNCFITVSCMLSRHIIFATLLKPLLIKSCDHALLTHAGDHTNDPSARSAHGYHHFQAAIGTENEDNCEMRPGATDLISEENVFLQGTVFTKSVPNLYA